MHFVFKPYKKNQKYSQSNITLTLPDLPFLSIYNKSGHVSLPDLTNEYNSQSDNNISVTKFYFFIFISYYYF